MTPLLVTALLRAGRDPLPYLLGLACASNIGSALTPIGNPQNILIAQRMELDFPFFVAVCAVPVVVSLVLLYLFLRRRLRPLVSPVVVSELMDARKPLDRPQAMKAAILTVLAIVGFCTPVPAVVTSLAVAAAVLLNRQFHTREMLSLVDWDLLVLFISLFVVMGAFEEAGFAQEVHEGLLGIGLDPGRGVVLVPLVAVLSNLVSNVPAVMLMLPFVEASREAGTVLALASSLAGNAFLVSSIANLIVVERARRLGVHVGFRDHLRVGLPVTLLSMLVALATGWILVSD
jgi:Na+/H+ antiporter NhaD/arsenite permease-like protein